MSVLSDRQLRAIWPSSNPGPASIDLHIGSVLWAWPHDLRRDPRSDQSDQWQRVGLEHPGDFSHDHYWLLEPNTRYLAATRERIKIPNDCAGQISARSSWGRDGLAVICGPAGWCDPGYVGNPTLELSVIGSELVLWPGASIAQLIIHRLESPCDRPYRGRYQGDQEPTPSRSHLGDTASIPLRDRSGEPVAHALVDVDDADKLMRWRWSLDPSTGYARRNTATNGKQHNVWMHREILSLVRGDGLQADHINGNRIDNRRSNLRVVTSAENRQNVLRHGGTSLHRGVCWDKQTQKWLARVQISGKAVSLGRFSDELEAARVAGEARARLMPLAVNR